MEQSPQPPMPLPRFTFLLGTNTRPLADTLVAQDKYLHLDDFESPLRYSLLSFLNNGGLSLHVDLSKPEVREQPITIGEFDSSGNPSYAELLDELAITFEDEFGANILAKLALKDAIENEDIFPRVLYRDCKRVEWTEAFATHYGHNAILLIICGELPGGSLSSELHSRALWLGDGISMEGKLAFLRKSLFNNPKD